MMRPEPLRRLERRPYNRKIKWLAVIVALLVTQWVAMLIWIGMYLVGG